MPTVVQNAIISIHHTHIFRSITNYLVWIWTRSNVKDITINQRLEHIYHKIADFVALTLMMIDNYNSSSIFILSHLSLEKELCLHTGIAASISRRKSHNAITTCLNTIGYLFIKSVGDLISLFTYLRKCCSYIANR